MIKEDNYFEAMTQVSRRKLEDIVNNQSKYNPIAVRAAAEELKSRELLESASKNDAGKPGNDLNDVGRLSVLLNFWSYVFLVLFVASFSLEASGYMNGKAISITGIALTLMLVFMFIISKLFYLIGRKAR